MGEMSVRNPTPQLPPTYLVRFLRLAGKSRAGVQILRGNKAKFNFPDNPPDIVGGMSLSPLEIQAVASKIANESTNNSCSDTNNAGTKMEQYASSSSDGGGAAIQVECNETIDWSSFLIMLDTDQGMSHYDFYPGLGDQFYPLPVYGDADDNANGDDDGDGFFSTVIISLELLRPKHLI
ncbi:hypothetical protein F3Y22_tig00117048pilonHSYRG01107 [Hibiscus syriacus]|uniref:Uncharacterized protein n=1 Tax=Hibiscus syriacus TaxID=106335 RepID=A0A6A2W9Z5_HIBSY|nr:ethylene-responsive transcription factor ERF017-like [Hibiscus syriacus]KAE8654622.1 hypothetical protein F3Y22_tig00117048pilonHSYRG01107 [Hibiscus syriacus]